MKTIQRDEVTDLLNGVYMLCHTCCCCSESGELGRICNLGYEMKLATIGWNEGKTLEAAQYVSSACGLREIKIDKSVKRNPKIEFKTIKPMRLEIVGNT